MMWERLWCRVLEETVMEVDGSVKDTIEKLRQQTGECRQEDAEQLPLEFSCNKRGRFWVYDPFARRLFSNRRHYFVTGQVREEQGKTVVRILSLCEKNEIFLRWLSLAFIVVLLGGYLIWKLLTDTSVVLKELLVLAGCLAAVAYVAFVAVKQEQNKDENLDIMKNEVIRRLETIRDWER